MQILETVEQLKSQLYDCLKGKLVATGLEHILEVLPEQVHDQNIELVPLPKPVDAGKAVLLADQTVELVFIVQLSGSVAGQLHLDGHLHLGLTFQVFAHVDVAKAS